MSASGLAARGPNRGDLQAGLFFLGWHPQPRDSECSEPGGTENGECGTREEECGREVE